MEREAIALAGARDALSRERQAAAGTELQHQVAAQRVDHRLTELAAAETELAQREGELAAKEASLKVREAEVVRAVKELESERAVLKVQRGMAEDAEARAQRILADAQQASARFAALPQPVQTAALVAGQIQGQTRVGYPPEAGYGVVVGHTGPGLAAEASAGSSLLLPQPSETPQVKQRRKGHTVGGAAEARGGTMQGGHSQVAGGLAVGQQGLLPGRESGDTEQSDGPLIGSVPPAARAQGAADVR